METITLPLIAAVGGFGVTMLMGGRVMLEALRSRNNDGDTLSLLINGKDYTVDLKTIGNGGSERIHDALTELECAN